MGNQEFCMRPPTWRGSWGHGAGQGPGWGAPWTHGWGGEGPVAKGPEVGRVAGRVETRLGQLGGHGQLCTMVLGDWGRGSS